jgi:hypothetical protein
MQPGLKDIRLHDRNQHISQIADDAGDDEYNRLPPSDAGRQPDEAETGGV